MTPSGMSPFTPANYVYSLSHSSPNTHRSAGNLPLIITHSKVRLTANISEAAFMGLVPSAS
jgi:hypothetical protein